MLGFPLGFLEGFRHVEAHGAEAFNSTSLHAPLDPVKGIRFGNPG